MLLPVVFASVRWFQTSLWIAMGLRVRSADGHVPCLGDILVIVTGLLLLMNEDEAQPFAPPGGRGHINQGETRTLRRLTRASHASFEWNLPREHLTLRCWQCDCDPPWSGHITLRLSVSPAVQELLYGSGRIEERVRLTRQCKDAVSQSGKPTVSLVVLAWDQHKQSDLDICRRLSLSLLYRLVYCVWKWFTPFEDSWV